MAKGNRVKVSEGRPAVVLPKTAAAKARAAHAKKSPERQEIVLKGLRLGMPITEAASYAGITRVTVRAWRAEDPVFDDACRSARAQLEAAMLARIEIASAETKNWAAAAWKLERLFPDRYGRAQRLEVTGKGGGPVEHQIDVRKMSDEELRKLASGETIVTYEHDTVEDEA